MRLFAAVGVLAFATMMSFAQEPSPTPLIHENVVVTTEGTETRIGDTPASVTVITARDINASAAPTLDDVLRQSVGFSIFRRSSSQNANPTTQGVSLRGVGASGASRTAILFDDVPLVDPFGGWVQWNRVPEIAVDVVEVRRGGASSLYGDTSLSGAINIIPRRVAKRNAFSADVFGGTLGTLGTSVFAGTDIGKWFADGYAAQFQTKGYVVLDPRARGIVDSPAGVRSWNFAGEIGRRFRDDEIVFVKPTYFGEVRANGTGDQTNRTHIRQLLVGSNVSGHGAHSWRFSVRGWGGTQGFDQVFTSVNTQRTAEARTRIQRVPAQSLGLSLHGSAAFGRHTIVSGFDGHVVRGSSDEIAFASDRPTGLVDSGGRERGWGVFARDLMRLGEHAVLSVGVRYDKWREYKGATLTTSFSTGVSMSTAFLDRSEGFVSPEMAVLVHVSNNDSLYAQASRSFRSPTLNELYRGFRVGNVSTLANPALTAEHADNIEAGYTRSSKLMHFRLAGFRTRINDAISNVTLSSTPALITRQRENTGSTTSKGIEAEADLQISRIDLSAGYMFASSRITSFPLIPASVGLWTPEVPRHQATVQARWTRDSWTVAVQGRGASKQFDDDQNQFVLEPYFQVDVFASKRLNEKLQIYLAAENILNDRYSVAKTPLRSISAPVSVRAGIRWN